MVQTLYHPPRENWRQGAHDGRIQVPMRPASIHGRDLPVAQSLRNCAGIPVKEYALFAILENGEQKIYSSSTQLSLQVDSGRVFDELDRAGATRTEDTRLYSTTVPDFKWTTSEPDCEDSHETHHYSSGDNRRRRYERQSRSEDSDQSLTRSRKKRSRNSEYGRRGSDEISLPMIVSSSSQTLIIGDAAQLSAFYLGRFRDLQQNACKILGKAFVKLIEPKKQTHHPYTKGEAKKPDWWPPAIRHKEPDHLLKAERIQLLAWVLQLLAKPNEHQLGCIQNLKLSIKTLREASMEALNTFFNDKDHPNNASKKKYLKEIFKIATQEERYLAGEIDGTTTCTVMFGDESQDESSDDEGGIGTPLKEEDDSDFPAHLTTETTPSEGTVSPVLVAHHHANGEIPPMFQGPSKRPRPSVGFSSQPHPEENQNGFHDGSIFTRTGSGSGFPSHTESLRRGFPSPGSGFPNYAWTPQNHGLSNSPLATSFYNTSPQPGMVNTQSHFQLPPVAQHQPMLPPLHTNQQFELAPSSRSFDMQPALGHQLRTGSIGHPHPSQHDFAPFMQESNGFGPHESEMRDQQHLHHPDR